MILREFFRACSPNPSRGAYIALASLPVLLGWAGVLAIAMSTQFLFQLFIWRAFDVGDIWTAWLGILRDRLVVATCIAFALALLSPIRPRARGTRMALYGGAVVVGAVIGETLLRRLDIQADQPDTQVIIGRVIRWTMVGGAIAAMMYLWAAGSDLAAEAEETRIEEARARRIAANAKLEQLDRQIEPHFLFNTLATVRRLQETDPARSQDLLERLFDYMSATLGERDPGTSTLGTEVALVCAYLEVCAARMAGRLTVEREVPAIYDSIGFPPLVLATLAENAIKHGISAHRGGRITISATPRNGMIEVAVADDGVGFTDKPGGSGIGLANIAERLRLLYGSAATLQLAPNDPHGVRASVYVPHRASTP